MATSRAPGAIARGNPRGSNTRSEPNDLKLSTIPDAVMEWLRPGDQPWSWAGSGRSGGVWDGEGPTEFQLTGPATRTAYKEIGAGRTGFFVEEDGGRATPDR